MSVYYKTTKIADIGFVLNLPSREDRKKEVTKVLFENHFTGWDFFDGEVISDPEMKKLGCTISELNIFKEFLKTEYETLLVIEDDVKILNGLTEENIDKIFDNWQEIITTYDVIALGTRMLPRTKISVKNQTHGQFSELLCSQGFVYHRKVVEHIVDVLSNLKDQNHPFYKCTIDMFLNDISNSKYRFIHSNLLNEFKFGITMVG